MVCHAIRKSGNLPIPELNNSHKDSEPALEQPECLLHDHSDAA